MVHLISEVQLAGYDDSEDWELVLKKLQAPEPLVLEIRDEKESWNVLSSVVVF